MESLLHDRPGRREHTRYRESERFLPGGPSITISAPKEAIFEVLSQELLERIRRENRAARGQATNAEELLFLSYQSYLNLVQSIDGAMDFIDRNQHHIRSQLYPSSAISGLAADLEQDLRRFVPQAVMSQQDRGLISSIIIAAGAEAVLRAGRKPQISMKYLLEFLTKFMMRGLSGWQSAESKAMPQLLAENYTPKKSAHELILAPARTGIAHFWLRDCVLGE